VAADAAPALALAARLCDTTSGTVRLVHVRIYDPPARGYPARFYPEAREVAAAIAAEAAGWDAHVIVLTRRPRTAVSRLLQGCVPDQVMRKSGCPVLAVHPGRA
jgi:nucleotide-binding universal stress UspA family protein